MAQVEIIAANLKSNIKNSVNKIKKVCAYARVSTDSEEQQTSYNSQIKHYSEQIKSNPEWEFVGVYADEGISGTQAKNRANFLRMIEDALNGKIDIIIAKSISRFARNTLDTLKYVRLLREHNVDVYFEKENIHNLELDSEMLLTLYSAFAQAKSESISLNIKLGYKAKMKRGEVCGQPNCYGYNWDKENQILSINEEQAEVVRKIFNWYVDCKGTFVIAQELNKLNIPTIKNKKWVARTVRYIIDNEKYVGDLLSQKYYVDNPMNHKVKVNKGEKDLYYVKNHHPAIISREIWDKAKSITEKRKIAKTEDSDNSRFSLRYPFSSKIICGFCGGTYTRRMGKKRQDGTRMHYWACSRKVYERTFCKDSSFIRENVLEEMFVEIYNSIINDRKINNSNLLVAIKEVIEGKNFDIEIDKLNEKKKLLEKRLSNLVDSKLDGIIDKSIYMKKEKEIMDKLVDINNQISKYSSELKDNKKCLERLKKIEEIVNSSYKLDKFDLECFNNMVDKIIVGTIDENGNKNPNVIKFILKIGKSYDYVLTENKGNMSFENKNKCICNGIL